MKPTKQQVTVVRFKRFLIPTLRISLPECYYTSIIKCRGTDGLIGYTLHGRAPNTSGLRVGLLTLLFSCSSWQVTLSTRCHTV